MMEKECWRYNGYLKRTVRHVQKDERESFARLEVERDGTHVGFYVGPSLIDGSFKASMALADAD
eukprot:6558561-Heterocapsa_arctica.AAC.1